LAWHDEFDGAAGTQPDSKNWGYDIGGSGWGNEEREYYTNSPANAAMNGKGSLAITAQKLDPAKAAGLDCWYNGPCEYTSARLLSAGKYEFTYGRVEGRIRIPSGQGLWPAFWMLGGTSGWPTIGEMDIMENIGKEPATVKATVHGPGYSGANGIGKTYQLKSGQFADDYHIFAFEWDKTELRWYVDNQLYFTLPSTQVKGKWVFDHPFFIILNVAVGGGWPGNPDASTTFPQTMLVDYVRVFQHPAP